MEPIKLILTALATGATAGASATATEAIKDAYKGLKTLITDKFKKKKEEKEKAEKALQEYEKDQNSSEELEQALAEVEADKDEEIIQAAQHILNLHKDYSTTQQQTNIHGNVEKNVTIGKIDKIEEFNM